MTNNKTVHVRYYETQDGCTGLYFTNQQPKEEMAEEIENFKCWIAPWEQATIKDTDNGEE